jgi:ribonucleotide monophosphatase NagD (HAD superfamily)
VVAKLWSSYDTLLADLDGVIYEGNNAIVDAVEVVNAVQAAGIRVGYVTNNSSRKASTIAEQLGGFGISTSEFQVIGSATTGL